MRDELSGRLLDRLLTTWTDQEQADWTRDLRRLAVLKFDDYEGFAAGERFFESLARWLGQFPAAERRRMVSFVRQELVFISRDELNHAIACVYPDFLKRDLVEATAEAVGVRSFEIARIVGTPEFRTLRRKTLYLGLSDGARLDRLRRSSPELSHEQFWLAPELGQHATETMAEKLAEAIAELELLGPNRFERVVLVDDFYGSGTSLIYQKDDGTWGGKLRRAQDHIEQLQAGDEPLLEPQVDVTVVVYVASAKAEDHIAGALAAFAPQWRLRVIVRLGEELTVTDPDVAAMCETFFDDVLIDKHKKVRTPMGYKDAALPLVLHHNTPNNSICPLWADSSGRPGGRGMRALFPRYERHHVDRP